MLSNLNVATVIPILILFLKMGIDTFNMTEVEKSILPDSKKLIIYLSQTIIFSIVGGLTLFIVMIFTDTIALKINDVLVGLITSFIIIFLPTLITFFLVFSFIKLLFVKVRFYLKYENSEWQIERRVDKTKLLVSREKSIYKFIYAENIMNKEIIRKLDKGKLKKVPFHDFIMKNLKVVSIIVILLIISLLIVCLRLSPDIDIKIRVSVVILLLISYMAALYIRIVFSNDKVMKSFERYSEPSAI